MIKNDSGLFMHLMTDIESCNKVKNNWFMRNINFILETKAILSLVKTTSVEEYLKFELIG